MLSFYHNYFLLIILHLCIKSTIKIVVVQNMTAIVSFYLIAILAQRVRSHSLQERNVLMALNAVLVLRTRIEKCSASEFQKTLTFKMMLHMLGAEPFL